VTENYRILVVDDNPSIHEDFFKVLVGAEYESESLEQAEEILFEEARTDSMRAKFELTMASAAGSPESGSTANTRRW
jgi:FixJ family two-component response regulator